MKKLVNIIITLFTIVSYGQIDIKDTGGVYVYVKDSLISTHNNVSNALEKGLNILKNNPNLKATDIKGYYKGGFTFDLLKDFFQGSKDTVFIGKELTKKVVDTTLFGWTANLINNKKDSVSYAIFLPDSTKVVQQVKLLNYSGLDCETCKRVPERTVLNVSQEYEGKHLVNTVERMSGFELSFNITRSIDSLSVYIQRYASAPWSYYIRESNDLDSLYKLKFELKSSTPGDGTGDPDTFGTLYRHSYRHKTKYWQVIAIRNDDGDAYLLSVEENSLME